MANSFRYNVDTSRRNRISRGLIIGVIVLLVLAVIGVGVGVVAFIEVNKSNKKESSNNGLLSFKLGSNMERTDLKWNYRKNLQTIAIISSSGASMTGVVGQSALGPCGLVEESEDKFLFKWPDSGTQLSLTVTKAGEFLKTFTFDWKTENLNILLDSWNLSNAHWYGGAEMFESRWPISQSLDMQPYVTSDIYWKMYGSVQERLWFNSNKFAVIVDEDVPLSIGWNESHSNLFILQAKFNDIYANFAQGEAPSLRYKIVTTTSKDVSLRQFHNDVIKTYFAKPSGTPDSRMFSKPIWSTWAKYKKAINQTQVMQFAANIKDNGFDNSQIEIDDQWAAADYGDFEFDPVKFPNPQQMITDLKNSGYRVTIWVHPFASPDSNTARSTFLSPYWVKYGDDRPAQYQPVVADWWDGVGLMLDSTSTDARTWFVGQLMGMKAKYGIDSFKFDAGEVRWLPKCFKLSEGLYPNQYTHDYVKMAAQLGNMIEVRSGSRNQDLPIFTRIMDKDSVWGYNNGLRSLITSSLTLSAIGYPFQLPDMIGGNSYNNEYPDRELFIRWVQANAFLPSMQFSIAPWDYMGDEVLLSVSRKAIRLHESINWDGLATEAMESGLPMIRPLWYADPVDESEEALTIADEFLVGNDILAVPVLDPGVTSRTVYLPPGSWRQDTSDSTGETFTGKSVISIQYPLDDVVFFTRIS